MIRKYLLAGLFTLLPLVVTLWILKAIFNALVGIFRGPLTWVAHQIHVPDPPTWGLALFSALATVLLLLLVGALVGNFIGRQVLAWLDELMLHVPVVKSIYGATRQLMGLHSGLRRQPGLLVGRSRRRGHGRGLCADLAQPHLRLRDHAGGLQGEACGPHGRPGPDLGRQRRRGGSGYPAGTVKARVRVFSTEAPADYLD